MWGLLLRNGAYAVFGALFAAIVARVIGPLLEAGLGPEADGTPLESWLLLFTDSSNVLLVILLSAALSVIVGAIVERRVANGGAI